MNSTKSNLKLVTLGLIIGIILSSMDNTIVSTAMGNIISDFGQMSLFIWVSSAYLITSISGMLIYGKLSDMYGRKSFYIGGVLVFILGSTLCSFSQSMTQLIIFRAIQGIGGGAIMPIALSIIFDVVPPRERGKIAGLFGAAFGISSIFGPLIGSVLSDYASWRWAFLINIPLGLLSAIMLYAFYFESPNHQKHKIDWAGCVLLVISVTLFMFALELGGKSYDWNSPQIISLFVLFILFSIAFICIEFRAAESVIPISLFKKKLFSCSQAIAFFFGSVFMITIVYIPIFIQGVYGGKATNSGLILMPMMIANVIGSQIGGIITNKISYRTTLIGSLIIFFTGLFLLSTLTGSSPQWLIVIYMIISGFGIGISFPVLTMSSIDGIAPNQLGSANSSLSFFRSLGMTIGLSVFGTIQNNIMQSNLVNSFPDFQKFTANIDARALLQPAVRGHIPANVLDKMTQILAGSITDIFKLTLISLTISFVFIIIMGNRKLIPAFKENTQTKGVVPHVNENGSTRDTNGGEQPSL